MDNRCSCPYCCGACEIIDERSVWFEPCNECKAEHLEEDQDGELQPKEKVR